MIWKTEYIVFFHTQTAFSDVSALFEKIVSTQWPLSRSWNWMTMELGDVRFGTPCGWNEEGRMAGKGATRTIGSPCRDAGRANWGYWNWNSIYAGLYMCRKSCNTEWTIILDVIILNHLFTLHLCCSMLCNDFAIPDLLTLKARNMA